MLNRLRSKLENHRSIKVIILKMVPLIIVLAIFLLGISTGLTDPTTTPPTP
ncbi:MAG: hypothetical protein ACFFB2_03835 [Promethearchaeota archaeon]